MLQTTVPAKAVPAPPLHPRGTRARVLLCSVFGPYARDDEFGGSVINPMELYHNQVTRVQGPFSLRMFHRSWGIMLIQCNISAPCTVLDFPTLERFVLELKSRAYDVIGISSIIVNVLKVKHMCELIRRYQPHAKIVIGGHIANLDDLHARVDADHIVRGEGVAWFRAYLGEDTGAPIRHPVVLSPVNMRSMGVAVPNRPGETAATVIPSVGCPIGCNFCSTSAMFGGKGRSSVFYASGDELFEILCGLERETGARSFFVMDENFLLDRRRALALLSRMEAARKPWALYLFSSANVLRRYSMDELLRLGVSWVWLGLEGKDSRYGKLAGADTRAMVHKFQENGIRVLGSTIIGLESHTRDNIHEAIDYAVAHATDFHQFMLYTPLPGTQLHRELAAQGRILAESEVGLPKIHGQERFNYRHPHLRDGEETALLLAAFRRDFEVNGPSVVRIIETTLKGWLRHKNHPDPRVRDRVRWEGRELPTTFAAVVAAARNWLGRATPHYGRLGQLLGRLYAEFGLKARLAAALGGRYVLWRMRAEARRLAHGMTLEPPTFYEANFDPGTVQGGPVPARCRFVECAGAL
ncbi:MAG: cobalamin B12-binding domain-containing protein [Planctomycetes bacterium]|nr:cobalamin B12-binding domain-containing protein [Planctomycetota bacterium]MCL4729585.1 cobalamin-dependent protein [Planctomycetota bacterium]